MTLTGPYEESCGAYAHDIHCAVLAARVKVVRHNRLRVAVEKNREFPGPGVADEIRRLDVLCG